MRTDQSAAAGIRNQSCCAWQMEVEVAEGRQSCSGWNQTEYYVDKLVEAGFLEFSGEKTQRHYSLSKKYKEQQALIHTALEIGLK